MKTDKGYTRVELMVTMASVGILSAIAYPMFMEQVRKTRRADAQSALLELSQYMERNYTNCNSYDKMTPPACATDITLPFDESPVDGADKYYDLSLSDVDETTYTIQASPKGGTMQASDRCGDMSITNTGEKTVSTAAVDCWR